MAKKAKTGAKEYTASCVSCGALVTEETKFVSGGRNYCTSCAIISKKEEPALKVPEGIIKWLCYLVSFLSPLAGFVLGIIFLSQKDQASRVFGRHCVIVICISLALISVFLLITCMMAVMGIGGDYSGPYIGEGYY
jgi:ABC-type Fe3+ transport system permease subunit